MSIKINLFYPNLQEYIGNLKSVYVKGDTVGECLQDFVRRFHGAERFLFDDKVKYLRHVFVYINVESSNKARLNEPVRDGDEIIIAVLVTGG
jgi:molybdopterin converting factor small subunit